MFTPLITVTIHYTIVYPLARVLMRNNPTGGLAMFTKVGRGQVHPGPFEGDITVMSVSAR